MIKEIPPFSEEAHTFEEACKALSDLCDDKEYRLQGQLESSNAVGINEDHTVWLQQAGNKAIGNE